MAIRIDVVVVVIDRGDERVSFIPFVGMLIAPCFKSCFPSIFKFFKAVTAKKGPSCLEGVHPSTGFGGALSPRCMYFGRSRRGSLVK